MSPRKADKGKKRPGMKSRRGPRKGAPASTQTQHRTIAGIKVPALTQLVNVYLSVKDVDSTADFYAKAFGFKKKFAMPGPDGKSVHAELLHGNCTVMIGRPNPESAGKTPSELGGTPATVYVYVKNVDALADRARASGANIVSGPRDEFWGDRVCAITDPEGHHWWFATVKRIVPPEEMHPPA